MVETPHAVIAHLLTTEEGRLAHRAYLEGLSPHEPLRPLKIANCPLYRFLRGRDLPIWQVWPHVVYTVRDGGRDRIDLVGTWADRYQGAMLEMLRDRRRQTLTPGDALVALDRAGGRGEGGSGATRENL